MRPLDQHFAHWYSLHRCTPCKLLRHLLDVHAVLQIMRQDDDLKAITGDAEACERLLRLLHEQAQCVSHGAAMRTAAAAVVDLCDCETGRVHLLQTSFRGKSFLTAGPGSEELRVRFDTLLL